MNDVCKRPGDTPCKSLTVSINCCRRDHFLWAACMTSSISYLKEVDQSIISGLYENAVFRDESWSKSLLT